MSKNQLIFDEFDSQDQSRDIPTGLIELANSVTAGVESLTGDSIPHEIDLPKVYKR